MPGLLAIQPVLKHHMNPSDPIPPDLQNKGVSVGETFVIPVIQEEAHIDLVREQIGTVRVRKVIHQTALPIGAVGYREVVETSRVPVNRVVQEVRPPWHEGDVLVIPVYEERQVIELVLLEEIHVARRRQVATDKTAVSLRRVEVIVERLNPDTGQWVSEIH